jgi:hypothetical protein
MRQDRDFREAVKYCFFASLTTGSTFLEITEMRNYQLILFLAGPPSNPSAEPSEAVMTFCGSLVEMRS